MLYLGIAALVLLGLVVLYVHKTGVLSERTNIMKKDKDAIKEKNKIHHSVDTDKSYRDRVRDFFR